MKRNDVPTMNKCQYFLMTSPYFVFENEFSSDGDSRMCDPNTLNKAGGSETL